MFVTRTSFDWMLNRIALPREPVLWEATFEKGDNQWDSIMPLTVAVVPDGVDGPAPPPSYTPMPMPIPNWLRPREPLRRVASLSNTSTRTTSPWWVPRLPRLSRRSSRETMVSDSISLSAVPQDASHQSIPSLDPTIPAPDGGGESGMKKPVVDPEMTKPSPMYSNLQVVVMVTMPSQQTAKHGSLGDLQFGVTKLPVMWDGEESF